MKFIDVSNYQGIIDWEKVKNSGIKGVIIRAGWGRGNVDPRFRQYAEGAIKAGLNVGIYWFSYAYTVQMAKQEAIYCHATIADFKAKINMPVFFDWEYDSMRWAEKNGHKPDRALITAMTKEFCRMIEECGYTGGYYLNQDYARNYVNEAELRKYKRWFAKYTATEQKDCYLWQYSSKGKVDGISGNVDLDRLWIDEHAFEVPDPKPKEEAKDEEEYKMREIKKGSRGKAVKVWQIIVGADPDGVFGAKTDAATRDFQRRKGLTVDGIVGKNSWKAGLESV